MRGKKKKKTKTKTKQIKTDQKQLKITHLYNLTPYRHCKFPADKLTLNKKEKTLKFIINMLASTRLLIGAPNDCFLQNICSEKQMLLRIFCYQGTANTFYTTVKFMCSFRILSNKCPTNFVTLFFRVSLPRLGYFSIGLGKKPLPIFALTYNPSKKDYSMRN